MGSLLIISFVKLAKSLLACSHKTQRSGKKKVPPIPVLIIELLEFFFGFIISSLSSSHFRHPSLRDCTGEKRDYKLRQGPRMERKREEIQLVPRRWGWLAVPARTSLRRWWSTRVGRLSWRSLAITSLGRRSTVPTLLWWWRRPAWVSTGSAWRRCAVLSRGWCTILAWWGATILSWRRSATRWSVRLLILGVIRRVDRTQDHFEKLSMKC